MRISGRWLAVLALALGSTLAVAYAGDGPLVPRSLPIWKTAEGPAALSDDGVTWRDLMDEDVTNGLKLVQPRWVRGPVRIRVVPNTFIDIASGSVAKISWDEAVRGWRVDNVSGVVEISFSNRSLTVAPGRAVTLTTLGLLDYGARDRGLDGWREVSGHKPFTDNV